MEITFSVEEQLDSLLNRIAKLTSNLEKLTKQTEYMEMLVKVEDLKPYERQEDLKKKLGISQETLNKWVAMGLEKQIWSDRNIRYEREELRKFLKNNFAV